MIASISGLLPHDCRAGGAPGFECRILMYHRFAPDVDKRQETTTPVGVFSSQLTYLKDNGFTVVPLRRAVEAYLGKGPALPPKSVVITVDDGHQSVYTHMMPLVKKANVPVTLFVYPSAIDHASYAMTWKQIRTLKDTGLFDIQSHTYWHPDFRAEKKRLSPAEYDKFMNVQFEKSRNVIASRLGAPVDMLAWPYGYHDEELMEKALKNGYIVGFAIGARPAQSSDPIMALPRYPVANASKGKLF
jgi:peptidoglycan/xylan/chitin deacetylase (PgdA/CDA1 family)